MATEITLTMEGMLLNWLKDVGENVSEGEIVAEIEADKATVEVESPANGVLLETRAEVGEEIAEGSVIGVVGAEGESASDSAPPTRSEQASSQPETTVVSSETTAASATSNGKSDINPATTNGRIKASPLAKRIAEDKGIDLRQVLGTGPNGRIVKADVESFTPSATPVAAPAPSATLAPATTAQTYGKVPEGDHVEILDINRMRRAIADSTILSKQLVPHFYVTVDIDVAALLTLRKELNTGLAEEGIKITVNDMIVKATAIALQKFPNLNTHYYGDKMVRHKAINIGIAVALPNNGLMNVVSQNADKTTLSAMAVQHKEMIARAREGKVKPDDIRGATFTVSNLGPFNIDHFSAIISPPEAGILAVGSAQKVPIVLEDGTLGIGNRMKVTISVDHRVSDGAEGAEYMQHFRYLIENPMRLLV